MSPKEEMGTPWDTERATLGRHFVRDMEALWSRILKLASVVEASLLASVQALCEGRVDLVSQVQGEERVIDRSEVQIEMDCLRILALHDPVASDLRRVAAVLKINGELERMGDLSEHIANRARKLAGKPDPVPMPARMGELARAALAAARDSFEALAKSDPQLARDVIESDHEVDRHRRIVQKELKASIRRQPERVNSWLRLINTARNLERIADHATNIAETVIYLKEGQIVRHVPTGP